MIYSFVRAGDSVNVAAHAGGFVCGAILFLILDRKKTRRKEAILMQSDLLKKQETEKT